MFTLSTYTTDRSDLDLIPTVLLDYDDDRNALVESLVKEVVNDCSNYEYTIYSNCFDDEFNSDDNDTKNHKLEAFIRSKFADPDVFALSIKVYRCISSGIGCDYENTYTINDTSKCIRTRIGEVIRNKKGQIIFPKV